MPEIRFYHLQRQSLTEALPKLVEKIYSTGAKTIIKADTPETVAALDTALWVHDPKSFIPHDTDKSRRPSEQPVFISIHDENPNNATIQLLVNAVESDKIPTFEKCLYMFDGRDESIVMKARAAWKAFKEQGYDMSYWQQRETGGWEQKA
ncbi:DNA polymerase III subunit chi [Kordiimonas pumila]|uniref:DNA polymerase III subunit chi n=1 Tax=Kordiimonas pumila TaxID=2161677 RepID=A0ABV7D1D8_9PROT|nr:DNA polymerase III subunit chi [Kordiimonas pumila]